MTHRGPFQSLLFCDSVILSSAILGPNGQIRLLWGRLFSAQHASCSYLLRQRQTCTCIQFQTSWTQQEQSLCVL